MWPSNSVRMEPWPEFYAHENNYGEKGIRQYLMIENSEETFEKDFYDKVHMKVLKRYYRGKTKSSWEALKRLYEQDPSVCDSRIPEDSAGNGTSGKSGVIHRFNCGKGEDTVDCDTVDKIPKGHKRDHEPKLVARSHENCNSTKSMKAAIEYKDQQCQTDELEEKPNRSTIQTTQDASLGIGYNNDQMQPSISSAVGATAAVNSSYHQPLMSMNITRPPLLPLPNPNQENWRTGSSPVIPPQPQQSQNWRSDFPQNQQSWRTDSGQSDYEKAKNWKPKNKEQMDVWEQTKKDVYQVLLVGKGCKLRSLLDEFNRVVQESLALKLEKLEMPSTYTLLVQMGESIYLKKDPYSSSIFVYPTLEGSLFESFANIAELVAEQRNNNYVIPDPNLLVDYRIEDLFATPTSSYATPYYGSYSNANCWSPYYFQNSYYPTTYNRNSGSAPLMQLPNVPPMSLSSSSNSYLPSSYNNYYYRPQAPYTQQNYRR